MVAWDLCGGATYAINELFRDEAVLSTICKREISEIEANAVRVTMQGKPTEQPGELAVHLFRSSRGLFSKDGKGVLEVRYIAAQGAPCEGSVTFDFHQDASVERTGKRGMKYTSEIELTNVVVTAK